MTSTTVTVTKDGHILNEKQFHFPKLSIELDTHIGSKTVTICASANNHSFFTRMPISEENELDINVFAAALRKLANKFSVL